MYLPRLSTGLNELIHVKHLEQFLNTGSTLCFLLFVKIIKKKRINQQNKPQVVFSMERLQIIVPIVNAHNNSGYH